MIDRTTIKLLALVLYVVTWSTWPFLWPHAFYHGVGLSIFIHWLSGEFPVYRVKLDGLINVCGILLAINNMLDEIFFDPKKFQLNEYVLLLIIIITVARHAKRVQNIQHPR